MTMSVISNEVRDLSLAVFSKAARRMRRFWNILLREFVLFVSFVVNTSSKDQKNG